MKISPTPIADLFTIDTEPFIDHRGEFSRLFCTKELDPVLRSRQIVQINHSRTCKPGAVRGLHFQRPPHGEMKLVRCLRGRIWDVAVDLRPDSKTYLVWHAEELSPKNRRMLAIPEGFAHGFQAIEQDSEILYLVTAAYAPHSEDGLRHDDPAVAIRWPLPVTDVSERDQAWRWLAPNAAGCSKTAPAASGSATGDSA